MIGGWFLAPLQKFREIESLTNFTNKDSRYLSNVNFSTLSSLARPFL